VEKMSVDERSFRRALGSFATGVTIVTSANADGGPVGVTVSSFSSLSLDPPLVLFCLGGKTSSLKAFKEWGHYVVNVLSDKQRELSILFANKKGDKFAEVDFAKNEHGCPIIAGCLATLECKAEKIVEAGDHLIFIGRVEKISFAAGGQPLVYFRGAYSGLGEGAA
jgi:flavin reductase (DIM6/NTAB) family NADH-FMN oxidoreductase RutF